MTNPWQPIDTAPMDAYESVLVYDADTEYICIAQYEKNAQPPFWSYDVHDLASGRAGELKQPTHWMPLPSPPTVEETPHE